ncbi:muts domain V-domain-containing protein [Armillaria novae-zelandiae]|uniref:DNA mismatch repair protein n=1 Tax=Armillaria novae-zelandiae TaxID=153914 RepID=A0AA39PTD7_9AGAR|nr:muts domain V-domain-containing protein [Armillaria novae-zelandiae]
MAPKAKPSTENMKQKSLMGWLSKGADATPAKSNASKPAFKAPNASTSKPKNLRTPESTKPDIRVLSSSASVSSFGDGSIKDTPPTSDPIDLDMLSEEEDAPRKRSRTFGGGKRKLAYEDDSDEGTRASSTTGGSEPPSSPLQSKKSRAKKPRLSAPLSDDDEDNQAVTASFSKRLTHFKKSPKKKGSRSTASSDDDDFIAPSDSDDNTKSVKSRSSGSSRRSVGPDTDFDDEDEHSGKKKKSRPAPKKASASTAASGGNSSFLTAAERREQDKKNEKKSAEDAYAFLADVKDKDGHRPGDPKYDPRTLYIPNRAWKEFTPFEKQFWEIKQNHYDTLYEDDARIGHQEFDLKLTQRVKMSMVGVPEMSFEFWAAKFLGKGYKVGRVDQAETALGAEMRLATDKSKGKPKGGEKEKISRELNKVYTNAFFQDDICRTKLETLMRQIRPKEMLFTKLSVSTTRLLKAVLPAACLWTSLREVEGFDYEDTMKELASLYPADKGDMDEDDSVLPRAVPQAIREMAGSKPPIEALGAMIWYLRQLNIDKNILSMKNFNVYDPMKRGQGLVLDGQTLAHIEVLLNNEGTSEGSLLQLLGRCVTPFGKRLFRIWLCMPLREVSDINARLDAVEDIMDHPTFEQEFTEIAKGLPDLERIVSRIHAKSCKVRDFLKVLGAFKKLSRGFNSLADTSEKFKSKTIQGLLRNAPDLLQNINNVEAMYIKPSEKDANELVPQDGKDEAYDTIMSEISELEEELDGELKKFEKKIGCKLNWWHSAIGNKEIYLVETSAGQKDVPKDWTKNGGTKAKTRWLVSSLQKSQGKPATPIMKAFKNRVFGEFDSDRGIWLRAIRVFAELDCLFSLAKASSVLGEPVCRPELVEGDSAFLDFKDLRHPTLAISANMKSFIPNDVRLGGDAGRIALLTGDGKSTAMRMTATGIIMAQLGMLVPAAKARICPVDAILTRMGAYDNMFSNASTFKVELDECCKILRDATPKSFVILDELGRGTSTYAVLHELATHTLPLSFFATHYGSLTDDFRYHPNIRNMYMSTIVDEEKRDIVFLYKLIDGVATSSFGTHVANLAGVPLDVVERADLVSKKFAQQQKQSQRATSRLPLVAQADFAYLYGLATGKIELPQDPMRQKLVLTLLEENRSKLYQTLIDAVPHGTPGISHARS